jgi:pimeloyl-ACP methyl ester carboxylesterase
MVEINELSIELENISLAALTIGSPKQEPVLCLHGYLDNAASFIPFMQQLSQRHDCLFNKYIIALDWPGHGRSQHRSSDAHYHFFDYVHDLACLFSHHNWPAINIVAHSMGAMVASAFAAAFPDKVKSLTLIDSLGFICTPAEETTEQLKQGLLSRKKIINASRAFPQQMAVKARLSVSEMQAKHAELIVKRALIRSDNQVKAIESTGQQQCLYSWRSDPRLRTISPYRLTLAQAQQLIMDIKCPVKLISGDKGMNLLKAGRLHFSSYFSDLSVAELQGGHHVHMEQSEQTLAIVNGFYRANKIKTSV